MSQLKDLTGHIYGYLDVQRRMPNYRQANGRTRTRWLCLCLLCGNAYVADGSHLLHGDIVSCGCLKNMKAAQRQHATKGIQREAEDLSGQIIGWLEVIERCENLGSKSAWLCRCLLCNSLTKVRANHLKRGLVWSCGCTKFSKNEIRIKEILLQEKIPHKPQYIYKDLVSDKGFPLRFDFALLDDKKNVICVIEYQGEQHSRDKTCKFGKQQREVTDNIKIDYCLTNRIAYFAIWYFHDLEEKMKEIVEYYRKSTAVPSSA